MKAQAFLDELTKLVRENPEVAEMELVVDFMGSGQADVFSPTVCRCTHNGLYINDESREDIENEEKKECEKNKHPEHCDSEFCYSIDRDVEAVLLLYAW